ncbi:NDP-sugar pyrophosphorylase, includes eIF-2Bgamma, eIF-2Bepsilon, and LPS biosynthesis proteins [Streptomyces sp. 3213]|uniref:sugar phosphate nucleotidyltransferase n=1 Tax=Streptomyces sp. 3213.3 TaxID=1855348 RepID=UPI00089B3113|nr:NDP-sugar synthase [Streptomyces sp. 3213.3]SEC76524.1 NDP-sugar pyrophosphorylase, includes eIF-2Bgamma, eIF-2Bepsilon, and LPS biosynthesis proteins [Streptomyces sp. 3213] [Streptomyces sp. 3213.3]
MGDETLGIILAGGRGERAKPLTLASSDYIRSKALIPFVGRSVVEWLVESCRDQGIRRFYVIAQGAENHSQIKLVLGHGERFGVEIHYSRARLDRYNVGSGAATLHNLEQWDLTGRALVLPVDSVFEFDLSTLVDTHDAADAVVTVAAVGRTPEEIAGKYGVMQTSPDGLVAGFLEKPDLDRVHRVFPETSLPASRSTLPTNAGMYLVDCGRLRLAARNPEMIRLAQQRLDWGGDLLPWLVGRGLPVAVAPIDRLGDLGSIPDYLATLGDVLGGHYRRMNQAMGEPTSTDPRYWIHESSLRTKDSVTGTTLAQKISEGSVVIGPAVRIGRNAEIGPGVKLRFSDIGDGVDVDEGARLSRTAIGDGAVVGPYARITDSYVGPLARVHSERDNPVRLLHSAIGEAADLRPGTRLTGVSVYPRLRVPALTGLPTGTHLTSSDDILHWI